MNDGTEQMEAGSAGPEDVELLRRYAEGGDLEALGQLFRRHADSAYRTALRVLRSPVEAEDAVQAAFVDVLRKARNYRGGEGVRVWILRIVTGTSIDMIRSAARRRQREERVVEEEVFVVAPSRDKASEEMADRVKTALDELPDKYRLPIWMHHGEGLSFQEIAGVLSISEVTLRGQVHRGLEMLRGNLGRAGVTMSGMALVTAVSSLPAEAAPASLLEALGGVAAGAGGMPAGGGAVAAGGKVAMGAGMKAAAVAGVILGGTALVTGVWYARDGAPDPGNRGRVAAPPAVRMPAREILRSWDFDSPDGARDLLPTYGGWRHVPNGGRNGSGCMETEETKDEITVVLMDVAIEQLPVVVTYWSAAMLPVPTNGHVTKVWWNRYGEVAWFYGMVQVPGRPMPESGIMPYVGVTEYVTESFADRRAGAYHVDFNTGKRKPDARLRLTVRGKHRIDDLQIRSIRPEDVPDVSAYFDALARIPPERRTGEVVIPELKPGPGFRKVSVVFQTGRE